MGLFSKKPKELEYDTADCVNKKTRMRELFNEAVADGDTYEILHATETSSKFEKGFVFNTNTTTSTIISWDIEKATDKLSWCRQTVN